MNEIIVNMHAAKSKLSELVQTVMAGGEVVIARDGQPVARLVPYTETYHRVPGMLAQYPGWGEALNLQAFADLFAPQTDEEVAADEATGDHLWLR